MNFHNLLEKRAKYIFCTDHQRVAREKNVMQSKYLAFGFSSTHFAKCAICLFEIEKPKLPLCRDHSCTHHESVEGLE